MRKTAYFILVFCGFWFCKAQNQLWKGYFSYSDVRDLAESETRIYAACETAVFSKHLSTNEIKTMNTVDGLSGQVISSIFHSTSTNRTFIGHENGLLIMINEQTGALSLLVGIRDQTGGIPPNKKKINDIYEFNQKLYISCDFGLVEFKLTDFTFGDTFYISPTGSQTEVLQTTVLDNQLYAVTKNFGIRKGDLSNPNLINFNAWQTFDGGFWSKITTFNNQLVAINTNNVVYRFNGNVPVQVVALGQPGIDIRDRNANLIITTNNRVYVFNESFGQTALIAQNQIQEIDSNFTSATIINSTIFIGTENNGVVEVSISNLSQQTILLPQGPSRNNIFSINIAPSGTLWAVYGDYNQFNNPYPLDSYGISKFSNEEWLNIPYEELLGAKSIVRITVNPNDENQVYASSYFSGLLKLENDVVTTLYNNSNSGLESLVIPGNPAYGPDIRVEQSAFDKNGNLWVSNGLIAKMIKVLKANGEWQSYDVSSVLSGFTSNNRMSVDKNGTKWLATLDEGVIAFNENYNNKVLKIAEGQNEGNLPSNAAQAVTIDNRNQLWIGTRRGLRILSSVDRFINQDELTTSSIIINDEGLAQELLFGQFITDIAVDGSNNKWVGTADSGVFLFSSNGQQTIYRFTTSNSPLPSNTINDIEINGITGEVFIATAKGMVSFKGTSTKPKDNLKDVYVYPNPVRPGFEGTVKVSGLTSKANVKITDIEGNLVHEVISQGGTIEWDTKAFGKYKVASGVYMIFISTDDALDTTVKKVMIIR
ncbi:T9SS type A sorting domain-containing protein [Flavobacterium sp.]|uniref:type IX secretion system anionic LPS delivery protein PorZ n=1 Tax=Flavobacterium sp. TaxID=239 RepID=UPI0039E2F106